jgi:hypothetical protein
VTIHNGGANDESLAAFQREIRDNLTAVHDHPRVALSDTRPSVEELAAMMDAVTPPTLAPWKRES